MKQQISKGNFSPNIMGNGNSYGVDYNKGNKNINTSVIFKTKLIYGGGGLITGILSTLIVEFILRCIK